MARLGIQPGGWALDYNQGNLVRQVPSSRERALGTTLMHQYLIPAPRLEQGEFELCRLVMQNCEGAVVGCNMHGWEHTLL